MTNDLMTIGIDQLIHDPLVLGRTGLVSCVFQHAESVLAHGGRVVLQHEYDNAPPHIIQVMSTVKELHDYKAALNEFQAKREQPAIE